MSLAHLSIYPPGVIHAPSNDERIRAWRAVAPVQYGNVLLTEIVRAAQYAREAAPGDEYEHDLIDGFALKYGVGP